MRKRREIPDEHERTFLSLSSIDAIPDSADEKSDKKVVQNIQERTIQTNICLKVTCLIMKMMTCHHSTDILEKDPTQLKLNIM